MSVTSKLIKSIRFKCKLSQQEFANKLSVHRVSVANWEGGKQDMLASKLISILKDFDYELYKMILLRINENKELLNEKRNQRIKYLKEKLRKLENENE